MFEDVDLVLAASNQDTPLMAPLSQGEVMSAGVYTRTTLGHGHIVSSATTMVTSENQDADDAGNIVSEFDMNMYGGRMYVAETMAMIGVGDTTELTTTTPGTQYICPFIEDKKPTTTTTYTPAFCNQAEVNAVYDISSGIISTDGAITTIAGTNTTPVSVSYNVNAIGNGLASVRFDALSMDARCNGAGCNDSRPSVITEYEDTVRLNGHFNINERVSYLSGLNL
jgi:hypothetical protein